MTIQTIQKLMPLLRQAMRMTNGTLQDAGIYQRLQYGYDPGIMDQQFKEALIKSPNLYELSQNPNVKDPNQLRTSIALSKFNTYNNQFENDSSYFPSDHLDFPLADPIAGIQIDPNKVISNTNALDDIYNRYLGKHGSPAVASAIAMLKNNPNIGI